MFSFSSENGVWSRIPCSRLKRIISIWTTEAEIKEMCHKKRMIKRRPWKTFQVAEIGFIYLLEFLITEHF